MKVYKYRGINNIERDFKSLLNNQIYAPPYNKLNDPFECTCNESITIFTSFLENIYQFNSKELLKSLNNLISFKEKIGIYSLSKKYDDDLLWSYYADSHKGICIEYDLEKLHSNHSIQILDVNYLEKPPVLSPDDISNESLFQKLFATKSLKWQHEDEIRLIFDDFSLKEHHPSALTGIYFGLNFPKDKKNLFYEDLNNRNIKFYDIFKKDKSYSLLKKLIHKNKRKIKNPIDKSSFEIIRTNHNLKVENFDIIYKNSKLNKKDISDFIIAFRENFTTKQNNISLFDDKSVIPLINKYPLNNKEYIKLADHYIALSSFDLPEEITFYPYQDFQYQEKGGKNWMRDRL